jgi:hypothetical protein
MYGDLHIVYLQDGRFKIIFEVMQFYSHDPVIEFLQASSAVVLATRPPVTI